MSTDPVVKLQAWMVQRRLPGAQGANGCWNDQGEYEARSAAEAVEKAIEGHSASYVESGTYWRAAPAQQWEKFIPRVKTVHQTTVEVLDAVL